MIFNFLNGFVGTFVGVEISDEYLGLEMGVDIFGFKEEIGFGEEIGKEEPPDETLLNEDVCKDIFGCEKDDIFGVDDIFDSEKLLLG